MPINFFQGFVRESVACTAGQESDSSTVQLPLFCTATVHKHRGRAGEEGGGNHLKPLDMNTSRSLQMKHIKQNNI